MTDLRIADDLAELLPTREAARSERDDRPLYYLWTFDPTTSKVHIDHNEDKHPADAVTHKDLAPHVTHPDKVDGFAYSIKGGWRITAFEAGKERPVEDPYILRKVEAALARKHPPKELPTGFLSAATPDDGTEPLPRIRYHGDP